MVEPGFGDPLRVFLQSDSGGVDWSILAPTIVIAFAAIFSAGSAIASVVLTKRLSDDNRALRKASTEPKVVAYLGVERRSAYLVYLVLENVGQGPACDVEFFVEADPEDFANHRVAKVPARTLSKVTSLLPQGGKSQRFMGGSTTLLGSDPAERLQPFSVKVTYSNLRSAVAEPEEYRLDIAELGDLVAVVPPDERIANSVEKIQKQLASQEQQAAAADEAAEEAS